jgi:hypothetical protein
LVMVLPARALIISGVGWLSYMSLMLAAGAGGGQGGKGWRGKLRSGSGSGSGEGWGGGRIGHVADWSCQHEKRSRGVTHSAPAAWQHLAQ